MKLLRVYAAAVPALILIGSWALHGQGAGKRVSEVRKEFENPPDNARIMMRWWWFGPAVTKPELERELRVMKEAGIGGVEIQPVYPLELDDPQKNFRNLPYLSNDFLDAVSFTNQTARRLGMRVDITLGSGWPYGGPDTVVTEAAGRLRCDRVPVREGEASVAAPYLEHGEELMAAFLVKGDARTLSPDGMQSLTVVPNERVRVPAGDSGPRTVLFFISSRTGQQVKRPAVGAEGFVLDHYDRRAIEHHLSAVGERLLQAFGSNPPYAVFSDSLEVFASDWTPNLLNEFQKRRGYDLKPHLPALVGDIGEDTMSIRHDWGKTLTELADEDYLTPIREWAHQHHTLFRSQTYGVPPVVLSSNALVDLPEGEAPHWRGFGTGRWAASASHLYGRTVTSSETFTWLHSPAFRATPLDMKADADIHFLQGINQLVGHGWPYSAESAGEPGWRFYASGALNDHNPWFQVMPEVTKYLQRMSYLLRQGKPDNDVAVYLPTDDAWASFTPGKDSVDRAMDDLIGSELVPQILNAGYNFDFIDDRAIASVGIPHKVVVLPGVQRMPLSTLEKLQNFVQQGGILIATRRVPSLAPGLMEKDEAAKIRDLARQLLEGSQSNARFVQDEKQLGQTLTALLTPDFATGNVSPVIGFVHRKLSDSDIYFVVNTSDQALTTEAQVRTSGASVEWWDPMTGETTAAECKANGKNIGVALRLEPYQSEVLAVTKDRTAEKQMHAAIADKAAVDVSADWTVAFPKLDHPMRMQQLHSWTDDEQTRYFSGQAVYTKTVQISEAFLKAGSRYFLDFGAGTPIPHAGEVEIAPNSKLPGLADSTRSAEAAVKPGPGTRTWIDSPVRESAIVYVNGKKAGAVWHPPYRVEVTRLLHSGENQLQIAVANTAINELAGQATPNYRLLNLLYGVRFTAQDMDHLTPIPSGILGKVVVRGVE